MKPEWICQALIGCRSVWVKERDLSITGHRESLSAK